MSTHAENPEHAAEMDEEIIHFRRKHRQGGDLIAGLNLTAMMDVLTILLVYLIKVYADAPENITLNDDLRPPSSTAPENIVPSVQVLISKSGILVDQKKVIDIKTSPPGCGNGKPQSPPCSFEVVTSDPKTMYDPLAQALAARVDLIEQIAQAGGSPFDGNLMIVADEGTPYDIVSKVLYWAGKARFKSYRLVVRRGT